MLTETSSFTPLRYHRQMRDLLKSEHSEVWQWFSSVTVKDEHDQQMELALLKSTYRMEREAHPSLYDISDSVCTALEIQAPVTLYQSQSASPCSAALYFTPEHAHVVFFGDLLELLDEAEIKSVIAHELSHFKLWTLDNGEYLVCDQVLTAMVNEPRAETCHHESAINFQLYTEVYADRGALLIADEEIAVSALLKVHTGIKNADAHSYMKQAEEIFSQDSHSSDGTTHPELFIRVRAMQLAEIMDTEPEKYQDEIQKIIQGDASIHALDMLDQLELTEHTRTFLLHHLQPQWLRTEAILAHVGYFFPDLDFESNPLPPFTLDLTSASPKVREYFSYLLIDIVAADRDLDDNSIAAAILTAEGAGIFNDFETHLSKELKLLKRDIKRIQNTAKDLIKQAAFETETDKREGKS